MKGAQNLCEGAETSAGTKLSRPAGWMNNGSWNVTRMQNAEHMVF